MGLVDYFRTLKALRILFLLFFYIHYVPNENGKVLEETLAGSNLDSVKTTLSCLRYFKITLLLLQVLHKFVPIPLSLCQVQ